MTSASAPSGLLPFPLLTADEQAAIIAAAYENAIVAAVVRLGVYPGSVAATQAAVPEFEAALQQADDWLAMRLVESLRQTASDPEVADRVRIPLAKQLLKLRPPAAWGQAKDAAKTDAKSAAKSAAKDTTRNAAAVATDITQAAVDRPILSAAAAAAPTPPTASSAASSATSPTLPASACRRVHEPVPRLLAESAHAEPSSLRSSLRSSLWASGAAVPLEQSGGSVDERTVAAGTFTAPKSVPSALAPANPRPNPPQGPSPPPDQPSPDQPPLRPPRSRRAKKQRGAKPKRSRPSR